MSESEKVRAEELKRELGIAGDDREMAELTDEDLAVVAGGVGAPRYGGPIGEGQDGLMAGACPSTISQTIIFQ